MYAIQKQLPYGRKRYTKDFQAALHVEDLAANFARTEDIKQLQQGLEKAHEEKHHSSQKGVNMRVNALLTTEVMIRSRQQTIHRML